MEYIELRAKELGLSKLSYGVLNELYLVSYSNRYYPQNNWIKVFKKQSTAFRVYDSINRYEDA